MACASDEFYDIFNDLAYARQDVYRQGTESFRSSLFPFEERVISKYFPSPPGNVLVGAAGGGREALMLARQLLWRIFAVIYRLKLSSGGMKNSRY